MHNSTTLHKMLPGGGRCNALLTLAMLLLLTITTSARAAAINEEYAVYDNGTLTFYCDDQKESRSGMSLNEGGAPPQWSSYRNRITTVVFNHSFQLARPQTCKSWFEGCPILAEIEGIEYLNTSEVTDMSGMFLGCISLKSLDLSSFNTSKVTNMNYMFSICSALEYLALSSFNTSNVMIMSSMFQGCSKLKFLDLSSFNTSRVSIMSSMFQTCSALETILVGDGWNVKNVKQSQNMFSECRNLTGGEDTEYDEGHIDATYARIDGKDDEDGYLTSAEQAAKFTPCAELIDDGKTLVFRLSIGDERTFEGNVMPLNKDGNFPAWLGYASAITTVIFDPIFRFARPKTCYLWFYNCINLTEIKGIKHLNTSEVTDMESMFSSCPSLQTLDLSSFNTSAVTDMSYMFFCCSNLKYLDLSSFNTSKVVNMTSMFVGCSSLETLDLTSFNTSEVTVMEAMFSGCTALKTILAGNDWNVEKQPSSFDMFYGCENLTGGNGTSFKDYGSKDFFYVIDGKDGKPGYLTSPSQCTPYAELMDDGKTLVFRIGYKPDFDENPNIKPLIGNYGAPGWSDYASAITTVIFDPIFRHARPKTCNSWFSNCINLTEIKGIEYLNTSEVTNMRYMFYFCSSLKYLDLSSFNTSEVTDMSDMFYYCSALVSLDLSSFNTSEVSYMIDMFYYCSALVSLDLSSFNTSGVSDMSDMFYYCSALVSLDLSSFNTSGVSYMTEMFYNCSALKTILVGEKWSVENTETSLMFSFCDMLTGGKGTKYQDVQVDDGSYAHIDGGPDKPGYLTSPSQCTPYAELTDEGKTLVFRLSIGYEPTFEGNVMPLNEDDNYPEWYDKYDSKITTVVFDPMFRHARPKTCYCWFSYCCNLEDIKGIEYLNTSEVENMNYMFDNCGLLKSLDLSSFNTKTVKYMDGMFFGCFILNTILVGEGWDVSNVTESEDMFSFCVSLTGGSGTKCDGIVDATRAVIDGKDNTPGYLTLNALALDKKDGVTTAELQGDFTDGSGAAVVINKATKVDELTFYRQFTKEVTSTVMFPFSFNAKEQGIQGTFHTVTKVGPDENDVWTALMSYPVTNIQANTPYIFSPSEDIAKSISFKNITLVPNNEILPNGTNGWQLNGVYSKKIWEQDSDDEYGFAGQEAEGIKVGEFVLAGEGAWADPMRCYLTYTGTGNRFSTAKSATVLPDRIRVVFPSDNGEETTDPEDPEDVITPVSSISEPDEIKVWSFGGTVFIEAQPDMDYTIIDLSGRVIKKGATHSTREEVSLNAKGIVIVRIANKSFKIK